MYLCSSYLVSVGYIVLRFSDAIVPVYDYSPDLIYSLLFDMTQLHMRPSILHNSESLK